MSGWYEGAEHRQGARADVAKSRMEVVKLHYTVGQNSTPIGDKGYFTFLISRNGHLAQFAPVDAICWDSSEWNDAGPGIEFEYHPGYHGGEDQIVNAAMADTGRGLLGWLCEEHGFHRAYYDGARVSEFGGWRGFISHRSLIQTEAHHDYITMAQFNSMMAPARPSANWPAIKAAVEIHEGNEDDMTEGGMRRVSGALNATWLNPKDGKLLWVAPGPKVEVIGSKPMRQPSVAVPKAQTVIGTEVAPDGAYNVVYVGEDNRMYVASRAGEQWQNTVLS